MNDDLTGYNRNGANVEAAEERCVLQAVGEARYKEYLAAYAEYRRWDSATYGQFLRKVETITLAPAPNESDEADKIALEYLRNHADGTEHLLVYNGELHDVSLSATRTRVKHDPDKLQTVISTRKPMIFFHNHPAGEGRPAMFPSYDDFGVAGLFSFLVYREDPNLTVEFRVIQFGTENAVVSYGFKQRAVDEIKSIAAEYRNAAALHADVEQITLKRDLLDYHLAGDSFNEYLQYACPVDLTRKDPEVCRTHPQFFLWPSDRFFLHYRPQ
jgi:hypothetical protein